MTYGVFVGQSSRVEDLLFASFTIGKEEAVTSN